MDNCRRVREDSPLGKDFRSAYVQPRSILTEIWPAGGSNEDTLML